MSKYAQGIFVMMLYINSVKACPSDCADCSHSSYCLSCKPSFYVAHGSCYPCQSPCKACNGIKCTSCELGRYGSLCQYSCPTKCLNGCHVENGNCNQCEDGVYGQNCKEDCALCKDELCDLLRCRSGCKTGYYEYNNDNAYSCRSCPSNCKYCKREIECTACNDGFYLFYTGGNVYCKICSPTVSEPSCQDHCGIPYCNKCQVENSLLVCIECVQGYVYNGNACIPSSTVCSDGCSGKCDVLGICLDTCNAGFTGERCAESCSSQCMACTKTNSTVCQQCKGDYYTISCDVGCPPSCRKTKNLQTCSKDKGYCLYGCEKKWWGHFCNTSCSSGCDEDGVAQVCNNEDGKCTYGCKNGFTGNKCETILTATTTVKQIGLNQTDVSHTTFSTSSAVKAPTTSSKANTKTTLTAASLTSSTAAERDQTSNRRTDELSQEDDKTVIIGSAAGGGVALLLLISVLIFCFIKTRRKPETERRLKGDVKPNGNQLKVNQKESPLKSEHAPGTQDYIYAKPIKTRKNGNQSKGENESPQKKHDSVTIDVDMDDVTVEETDLDAVVLEDLEGGTSSIIDIDVDIPTTDIYYNTLSLIRSRIQVSDLLDYIKTKTDFEKEFERQPKGLTRPCIEALEPNNRLKNRFNGIYAYDATRVVLQSKNFINANYVDGHNLSPAYIASLGPTKSTMSHFETCWEMIWQEKIDSIVMLTKLKEGEKMKCEQYWPEQGTDITYGDYNVKCDAEKIFSEFVVRDFAIVRGPAKRKVTQFHYTAWPDKTVPGSVASLIEFRDKVEQANKSKTPMMVHCSAGIGRTGTYIALDILIREGKEVESVDIFGCVNALRGQRVQMVQNLEQYVYLHHCVLYALTCDAVPLPVTAVPHYMRNERISKQYQAFVNMQLLANHETILKTNIKNKKEIRKGADIPGEEHRVRLTLIKHDYINAVYLNGYLKEDRFIVAQTPLPNTVEDFVSMLYQERCPCVVCLDEENIKDKSVAQYLPPANKVSKFGHFQVACMKCDQRPDFVIRELKISMIGSPLSEELSIFHYQFNGWSRSDSVPPCTQTFLNMVIDVDKTTHRLNCEQPIVVHCSTGAERSGIFCAVSILREKVAVEKELSVLNTICQVCARRRSAFRDIEHLRFCYSCVEEVLEMSDTNTYYNIRHV